MRKSRKQILRAALTHISNEEKVKMVDSDVKVKNSMLPSAISAPEKDKEPLNTHFSVAVKAAIKNVLAGTDGIFMHKSIAENEQGDAEEVEQAEEVEIAEDNTESEDKAPVADDEAPKTEEADLDSEDNAEVDIDLESGVDDEELQETEEPVTEEASLEDNALEDIDPQVAPETLQNAQEPAVLEDESIDIVDADNMDDQAIEDIEFVVSGTSLHAIKANRIIATLTKRNAIKAKVADTYTTDNFCDAVQFECGKVGLRAGLKSCGFTLASIKVKGNTAFTNKVEAKTKEIKASYEAEKKKSLESWKQCLALACEGINRNAFKGYKNPVRTELAASLNAAGITNANKVIRSVFASKGSELMQQIVALATKLQAQPEEVRDNLAEQLDMTVEPELEADMDSDFLGDEVIESAEEEEDYVPSLEASLLNPLRKASGKQVKASNNEREFLSSLEKSFNLY